MLLDRIPGPILSSLSALQPSNEVLTSLREGMRSLTEAGLRNIQSKHPLLCIASLLYQAPILEMVRNLYERIVNPIDNATHTFTHDVTRLNFALRTSSSREIITAAERVQESTDQMISLLESRNPAPPYLASADINQALVRSMAELDRATAEVLRAYQEQVGAIITTEEKALEVVVD